jgi:hypothetical protein
MFADHDLTHAPGPAVPRHQHVGLGNQPDERARVVQYRQVADRVGRHDATRFVDRGFGADNDETPPRGHDVADVQHCLRFPSSVLHIRAGGAAH